MFEKEVLVEEGGQSYWILVQKQVFPHLLKEVPPKKPFKAFLRYYGTLVGNSAKESQPLLLMIDFEKKP